MMVVDASAAMACLLPDESGDIPVRFVQRLLAPGAFAPSIWPAEVLNAVCLANRRGRVPRDRRAELLVALRRFHVTVESAPTNDRYDALCDLALSTGLTVYDASYLDLAIRRGLALATLDRQLARAADAAGVALVDLPA